VDQNMTPFEFEFPQLLDHTHRRITFSQMQFLFTDEPFTLNDVVFHLLM